MRHHISIPITHAQWHNGAANLGKWDEGTRQSGAYMRIDLREATRDDVVAIVGMLADDELGARREQFEEPLPDCYWDAFEAIDKDPNHLLIVAERDGKVIGSLQLSFLPYLTYRGGWRALIEAVRISSTARGEGLGAKMITWAVERARATGCHLIQLTCDKTRTDSQRFYERLGFRATHEGMKLWLKGSRVG